MQEVFKEIREQIHDIRNLIGPFDLKLSALDHQISATRAFYEEKMAALESRVTSRFDRQDLKIADLLTGQSLLSERIKRLELAFDPLAKSDKVKTAPVHEDKATPDILPPQKPAL
jgi:hypothetical protein